MSGLIVRLRTMLRRLGSARFDCRLRRTGFIRYGRSAKLTLDAAFQGGMVYRAGVVEQHGFDCILGDAFNVGVGGPLQRDSEAVQVHVRIPPKVNAVPGSR